MSRRVTFGLGPAVNLSNRLLTITRMHRAGDDSAPAAEVVDVLAGTATSSTQTLSENTIFQAILVDTSSTSGLDSDPAILNFHTGELFFPGPVGRDRLSIMQIEDMSSSSSSSVSSSSLSSQSTSSSSLSSSSASSLSSQSTSSSSLSSISTSSSSSSSSSLSSISTSSSSSSVSSQSASSSSSST